jgi:hypothetical protein
LWKYGSSVRIQTNIRTADMDSDLDREILKLKLRDILIGLAVAAALLVAMPLSGPRRGPAFAGVVPLRAKSPAIILPKPKPAPAATGHTGTAHRTVHASAFIGHGPPTPYARYVAHCALPHRIDICV